VVDVYEVHGFWLFFFSALHRNLFRYPWQRLVDMYDGMTKMYDGITTMYDGMTKMYDGMNEKYDETTKMYDRMTNVRLDELFVNNRKLKHRLYRSRWYYRCMPLHSEHQWNAGIYPLN
jgi:hypothetical protein